ncbi:MAG: RNA-binding protein [Anaerolineae bacterium]|nr:RNA-binding protein [Anaerolineae bacterium]
MKIYVGNLDWQTSETDLQEAFAAYGAVSSVDIIKDRDTGNSRGFGFVEMQSTSEAQAAINGLNERELHGRALSVNQARPREERSRDGGSRGPNRNSRSGGGSRRRF